MNVRELSRVLYCLWIDFYISTRNLSKIGTGDCLGKPLLCRLGMHKWENYGKEIQIFWQEPGLIYGLTTKSKVVFERRMCLRCGIKLRRKLTENRDGTLASVGWLPDTEDQPNDN
jgi:hypothetical protein